MSRHVKQLLCVLVVIGVMFSMVACSSSTEQSQETTTTTAAATTTTKAVTTTAGQTTTTAATTTQAVEENPFAEFFEITWIATMTTDYVEGGFDEKMLEERYNIDLKPWAISTYDPEGIAMMLAAGDMPDISHLDHSPLGPPQLYEQGLTRLINIEMYKKYFPYYYELMLQNEPTSYIHNNCRNEDGSLSDNFYGISYVVDNKWYYNIPLMRYDWLENIGYSIDDSLLTPITLTDEKLGKYSGQIYLTSYIWSFEDMNDIFRAFTEDDPDGNGEDDTYGAVIFDHSFRSHWTDLWWGQFGVISSDGNFLYEDPVTGDIVPWYAYVGYRDYMKWAVEMRDKGYIRTLPEGFQSLAPQGSWYDNLLANWMTGKIGYFFCDMQYIGRPDFPEYSDRQPPQSIWLNAGDESATFVVWPVLGNAYGWEPNNKWGTRRYNLDAFGSGTFRTWLVGKQVSDEKLARVLTMWNDANTAALNDPFWSKVRFGIEGVHYTWSGEPWNSARIQTDATKIPPHYSRYGGFIGIFSTGGPDLFSHEAKSQITRRIYEEEWYKYYCIEPIKYWSSTYVPDDMMKEYNDYWANISGDINNIIADFRNRSWNGQISNYETEWEQYINRLYDAGLEKLVKDFYMSDQFAYYKTPDLTIIWPTIN
jgi:putative aldouronate transport system substrate-binding protein